MSNRHDLRWIDESRMLDILELPRSTFQGWAKAGLVEIDPGGAYGERSVLELALLSTVRERFSVQELATRWPRLRAQGEIDAFVERALRLTEGGRFDVVLEIEHGGRRSFNGWAQLGKRPVAADPGGRVAGRRGHGAAAVMSQRRAELQRPPPEGGEVSTSTDVMKGGRLRAWLAGRPPAPIDDPAQSEAPDVLGLLNEVQDRVERLYPGARPSAAGVEYLDQLAAAQVRYVKRIAAVDVAAKLAASW